MSCDESVFPVIRRPTYEGIKNWENNFDKCTSIYADNELINSSQRISKYLERVNNTFYESIQPEIKLIKCDKIKANSSIIAYKWKDYDRNDVPSDVLCPVGGWCYSYLNANNLKKNITNNEINEDFEFKLKDSKGQINISELCIDNNEIPDLFVQPTDIRESIPEYTSENNNYDDKLTKTNNFIESIKMVSNSLNMVSNALNHDISTIETLSLNQKINRYDKLEKDVKILIEKIPQFLEIKSKQDFLTLVNEISEEAKEQTRKCTLNNLNGASPFDIDCDTIEKQNNFTSDLCKIINSENGSCTDNKNEEDILELNIPQNLKSIEIKCLNDNKKNIYTYELKSNDDTLDCPVGDFCSKSDNREKLKNYMINNIEPDPRCSV